MNKQSFLDWCAARTIEPYTEEPDRVFVQVAQDKRFTQIYSDDKRAPGLAILDANRYGCQQDGIYDSMTGRLLADRYGRLCGMVDGETVCSDDTLELSHSDIRDAAYTECAQRLIGAARTRYSETSADTDSLEIIRDNWWAIILYSVESEAVEQYTLERMEKEYQCPIYGSEAMRAIDEPATVIAEIAERIAQNVSVEQYVGTLSTSIMPAWDAFNRLPVAHELRNVYGMYHALDGRVDIKTVRVLFDVDGTSEQIRVECRQLRNSCMDNNALDAAYCNTKENKRLAQTTGEKLDWKRFNHPIPLSMITAITHGRKTLWERPTAE